MSLDQIVSKYRQELLAQEQQAEHKIRSAHSHMLSVVTPHLQALYKLLREAYEAGKKLLLSWLYEHDRLATIKHLVKTQVDHFGGQAKAQVLVTQRQGAILGETSAISQLKTAAPHKDIQTIGHAPFEQLVGHTQQGKPISDLMDGYGEDASDRVSKALIAGVSIGQKPDTISRAIDQALAICLWKALVLSRTSEMEAYRSSVLLTFQVNDDIAQMWEWVAQPGACPFCTRMDGTRHSLDENMVSHPNCRCVQKIITA